MTPDQCFNEMALVLNMPEDSGYEGILDNLKFLKEENTKLKKDYDSLEKFSDKDAEARFELVEENKKLKKELNDNVGMFNFVVKQEEEKVKIIEGLKKQNMKLMEQNTKLAKDYVSMSRPRGESPPRNIDGDVVLRLKREIDDLKKQIETLTASQ
jgi:hypothetical protein